MKCPKGCKNCKSVLYIPAKGKDYICSGISHKPTKYKKDNIWLCLAGTLIEDMKLEMTREEALIIVSALSLAASDDRLNEMPKKKRR